MGPDGLRRRRLHRHLPQLHRQDHEAHQAACPPLGDKSQREQCTSAVTNLLPPLDNGLGAPFHYLVIKGLTLDEIEEVERILYCMTTLEEGYKTAQPKGRHNVTRKANRYVYALWRLKFPTLTEVTLSFSKGREVDITEFRSLIVDTWNCLDRVGQTLLLKNIKIYQLLVIHELGPLCHLLLSLHASDVLNTNYEETLVIERWMEHLTQGMPAYEHRRKNRNYTTTYRMWGEKFETLPFHELRTEEAGHHWTPTAQEVHEMWKARLEDPTAAASPSYKGAAQKSKGLSVQVSSPPISKKRQETVTPGQATPV